MKFGFFIFLLMLSLSACTPLKESSDPSLSESISNPLPPEKAGELLEKTGGNWLYGQGVGETMLTVGTCVLFPPYALYVVGNAGLTLAGYERVTLVSALPEKSEDAVTEVYDTVTEAPGRSIAYMADEDFRTQDYVRNDMNAFLKTNTSQEKKWD